MAQLQKITRYKAVSGWSNSVILFDAKMTDCIGWPYREYKSLCSAKELLYSGTLLARKPIKKPMGQIKPRIPVPAENTQEVPAEVIEGTEELEDSEPEIME